MTIVPIRAGVRFRSRSRSRRVRMWLDDRGQWPTRTFQHAIHCCLSVCLNRGEHNAARADSRQIAGSSVATLAAITERCRLRPANGSNHQSNHWAGQSRSSLPLWDLGGGRLAVRNDLPTFRDRHIADAFRAGQPHCVLILQARRRLKSRKGQRNRTLVSAMAADIRHG